MTSCSLLYNLTESRKWWEVIDRCKTCPYEATYEDSSTFKNVLHQACNRGAPADAIRALVEAIANIGDDSTCHESQLPSSSSILCKRDRNGETPLMCAIKVKAEEEIIFTLLQAHPISASISDSNGWYPVHVAFRQGYSVDVLVELMEADPEAVMRHSFSLHYWDWYISNKILVSNEDDMFSWDNKTDDIMGQGLGSDFSAFWTQMAVLANVSHYKHFRKTICSDPFDELLHAVVGQARYSLPREFVKLVLKLHLDMAGLKDRDGNFPLHIVSATVPQDKTVAEDQEIIESLLMAYPKAIENKNDDGLYPLSLMIENGRCWHSGVKLLFRYDPDIIFQKHNNLYPFMYAAVCKNKGNRSDSESVALIYELLRVHPEQVSWCIQSSDES